AWRTVKSFLLGSRYRYSPVSRLYVFGRHQDMALQKARATIHERNHLRLWLAPVRLHRRPVWVGQVSRDTGVRVTRRGPTLTTHKIDADVDEAREYLVQDLVASQSVAMLGYAKGVGVAAPEAPRSNLGGDPYFTDGLRAVFLFTGHVTALDEV